MMKNVSVRLERDTLKEVDKLAKMEMVDKSLIIREALERGLVEKKLKTALHLFAESRISTSEAAKIAGISVGEIMEELTKRGINSQVTADDIKGSLEAAMRIIK